jgi:hypothetical protein
VILGRRRTCPPTHWLRMGRGNHGRFPCSPCHRSVRSASSSTPAASPCLRRSPSAWPPHRGCNPASELTHPHSGHALLTGPYPPDLSRHFSYGASTTDSLALRLLTSLAEPAPSGSTSTSRHCQGCSNPPRRPPDQAALGFNQAAATTRRSRHLTSTRQHGASRRTTAAKYSNGSTAAAGRRSAPSFVVCAFIDQVASHLRGYRHIQIGNGTADAGDVPVVA